MIERVLREILFVLLAGIGREHLPQELGFGRRRGLTHAPNTYTLPR